MKEYELAKIEIAKLVEHAENPNFMNGGQFNKLNENIGEYGIIENVVVAENLDGTYTILSGHHRVRAAKLNGYETVPCVVLSDLKEGETDWEDRRRFLLVRMNVVKGKIDPIKFTEMYNVVFDKYGRELAKELFGFWDERSFNSVYKQVKDALPPELQKELEKSKKEIKTIEDLARILNRLFSEYGNTLEYGFMWFSYGGQDHFWIQMDQEMLRLCKRIQSECVDNKKDINEVLREAIVNGYQKEK